MWDVVLLMGLVAGVGLKRIAAAVVIVSRAQPIRLLIAFCAGGIAMTFGVSGAILFLFRYSGVGQTNDLFPWIEIVAGVVALSIAVLVGSGLGTRLLRVLGFLQPSDGSPGVLSRLPLLNPIRKRVQVELKNNSPWLAGFTGVLFGLPTLYMIATVAAVLDARVGTPVEILALVVFSVLGFVQGLVPLGGFLVAPGAARAGLRHFYAWLMTHQRPAVATLSTLTGMYLVIKGISRL